MDGKGIVSWANGDFFYSPQLNGVVHEFESYICGNGDVYTGYWKNEKMDGEGILYWVNGDSFDGCLSNGLRDGFGVHKFRNGDVFGGNWKEEKMDGRGIMSWVNVDVFGQMDLYMDMEFLHLQIEMSTLVTLRVNFSMTTESAHGQMEQCTKAIVLMEK